MGRCKDLLKALSKKNVGSFKSKKPMKELRKFWTLFRSILITGIDLNLIPMLRIEPLGV